MFTTIYQQPNDINLNQEQFEIINPDIKISDFSLEKFRCADYEIEMIFSNSNSGKIGVKVISYIKSSVTPKSLSKDKLNYYSPELFDHIFKVNNSNLLKSFIEKTHTQIVDILKSRTNHYVFPLKNMIIEILTAGEVEIKKLS